MIPETLEPRLDLLGEEHVLVHAWKKTASFIRSHNWYADTLALDLAAANLPDFLSEVAQQLQSPDQWKNDSLRIVPAPKSQRWRVAAESGRWEPVKKAETARKLRPLAHVSFKDQVAATALMLCLADRVETLQGDPRVSIRNPAERSRVISYGNRLFCDDHGVELRHRWGSTKLYREYFRDYRQFLSRPELVADEIDPGRCVVFVQSDLRQFYDRVCPVLLAEKIDSLRQPADDPRFFEMARRILCWEWHEKDKPEVANYATQSEIPDFSMVALPQGLVAAGFFANVVLLDFDQELREHIAGEITNGVFLHDACRYVDDIRLVLSVKGKLNLKEIEANVVAWLQKLLNRRAIGLIPSNDKTRAALFRGGERPLVRQSRKMNRIQRAVSGGFDAIGGEEVIDALQSLVKSQSRYSKDRTEDQGWDLAPIPDVGDETVARFAAARFRSTFRSLRPLLEDREASKEVLDDRTMEKAVSSLRLARTRTDLDDEARTFALGLIENWVEDPSNVRLLRIGLDLWPAADVLERVFKLLCQYTTKGGGRKAPRRVAWYCLAEIFRAGATETGFVEDDERLPDGIDVAAYRGALLAEAKRLATLPSPTLPWYLKQQVLLFIAVNDPEGTPGWRRGRNPETKHYRELIRFLKGDVQGIGDRDFAALAILSRRSFLDANRAVKLVNASITPRRAQLIAERDPSFGLEIFDTNQEFARLVSPRIRQDLCLRPNVRREGWISLAEFVLSKKEALRSELPLLRFLQKCLAVWPLGGTVEVITPCDVFIRIDEPSAEEIAISEAEVLASKYSPSDSLYRPPKWCPQKDWWRLQLGYLLRFILLARHDFTRAVRPSNWKEKNVTYRVPESHWYVRRYGFYSGHSAFGADWLPISDWTEDLLFALLRWPGCQLSDFCAWVQLGIEETRAHIEMRIRQLADMRGRMSNVLMLPLSSKLPERSTTNRPLRICVVQTVIPTPDDFSLSDLSLSGTTIRRRHRNHLSAAIAAVERMLDLRETHKGSDGRLDLLILPELSVHPRDVETHLVPFARAHKAIVLAGLTYEELFPGQPLINSALWLIPVWSNERGFQVLRRRQGKHHLAPEEQEKNNPTRTLQGFRPCQWLVGYEWDITRANAPLWLTASVCYDATDIRLASDLRDTSDVFIVPALNKDVNTFDQMALALHYHMFQLVVVANNGTFGGSNAYAPYREPHIRQIFHLHGQPQASISFLEIDNPAELINRGNGVRTVPQHDERIWKYPPAGRGEP
ncbi:MAG: RNA-directed DNA polymerase [bacterium]|nr:RNA-directed DNA polymerase [bacterium]